VSTCDRLATIVEAVKAFIAEQWAANRGSRSQDIFDRDARFTTFAAEKVAECSEESMRDLLDEMRGLSHYFGSYCADQHRLESLLDALFEEVRSALLVKRHGEAGAS